MKRLLFLLLSLISCTLVYSQYTAEEIDTGEMDYIRHNDLYYDSQVCKLVTRDAIHLVVRSRSATDIPLDIYVTLKTDGDTLPEGLYTYDAQKPGADSNTVSSAELVCTYKKWSKAYRTYPIHRLELYIQQFEENLPASKYLISGKAVLNAEGTEHIDFLHYGLVAKDHNEVVGLFAFNPEDYSNNVGSIQWAGQSINTPCAYQKEMEDRQRLCIVDRIPYMDKKLEYGVAFEFDATNSLVSGDFNSDDAENPIRATFFNQGTIEKTTSSKLSIKHNAKKKEYVLKYELTLPNGQTLTGTYKGKIPEDKFGA